MIPRGDFRCDEREGDDGGALQGSPFPTGDHSHDVSEANEAAIKRYNEVHGTAIIIRQVKYVNHAVEQDHRAIKRVTRPRLGFKVLEAAQATLAGIELMHRLKKRQLMVEAGDEGLTAAEQFYSLAA